MQGFPAGETLGYLRRIGVTHISVICAIDGTFGPFNVPAGDATRCGRTIELLDASAEVRPVVRARWEGAPALLYELRK
jgi:hypothetical protein